MNGLPEAVPAIGSQFDTFGVGRFCMLAFNSANILR
jgi:hypothetical protein